MKLKSVLFSCLLGSVGMLSTQAIAGGAVGGDCCADLEERVAELEATTVRKGNRKVTLTISGNVHRGIIFTDRTVIEPFTPTVKYDKGPLITDTDSYQTKFRLYGLAAITRDVYVGYRIDLGLNDGGTKTDPLSEMTGPITLLHNDLLIGSRTYGELYLGHGNTSSDFSGESDLSGTNYIAGGSVSTYNIGGNIDGFHRQERIRYDTPSIAGFKASASWQENGNWDAALSYKGTLGDFSLVGKVAYYELGVDQASVWGIGDAAAGDGGVTGSVSALHNPTGLSLTFAAGEVDSIAVTDGLNNVKDFWYVKAGVQRSLIGLGKTYLSADYHHMTAGNLAFGGFGGTVHRDIEKWGVQLVQDIDAAAMKVYASYWNADSNAPATDLYNVNEEALMIGVNIDF